ncbi:hypothetical protein CCHL11_04537 [Colletotrichum chlorophyti]|uniref:Rhodopsin domain-containing protein n=1 Tax=Colletotrichum chlorophyti TaxID=708187 RepID=A0A1Q8RRD3_9PEZI|nr:hypothetical protein CCHL11_04537 [Colletotrichum chlorophyti]
MAKLKLWWDDWTALVAMCLPIESIWDRYTPGRCLNITAIGYAGGGFTIAYDFILITLPIPVLLKLNFNTRKKLVSMFMLTLGSLATIASMIRLKYMVSFAHTYDATWDNVEVVIWSTLEINLVMVCGSLPALKPLFSSVFKFIKPIKPCQRKTSSEEPQRREEPAQVGEYRDSEPVFPLFDSPRKPEHAV